MGFVIDGKDVRTSIAIDSAPGSNAQNSPCCGVSPPSASIRFRFVIHSPCRALRNPRLLSESNLRDEEKDREKERRVCYTERSVD